MHLHVNGPDVTGDFVDLLGENEFKPKHFIDSIFNENAAAPLNNYSRVFEYPKDGKEFSDIAKEFRDVKKTLAESINTNGLDIFIEEEIVLGLYSIEFQPYRTEIPIPFILATGPRTDDQPPSRHVHISLNRKLTDTRIIKKLKNMGFEEMDDKPGFKKIFSAQGTERSMKHIAIRIKDFLDNAGGVRGGEILEERVFSCDNNYSVVTGLKTPNP